MPDWSVDMAWFKQNIRHLRHVEYVIVIIHITSMLLTLEVVP